MNSLSTK